MDEAERRGDEEEDADDLGAEQKVVAEKDRPVRRVRRERERDIGVDAVREEADDRRCRDQSSDATERGDHGRAARRGDARRRREGRKSESQGTENGAADGGPHAEVPRPLGRNRVRDRREDEARGGDQNERGREHEVVEALALPKTPVDEVRDQEGDERRRRLEGDMELRARVGEREARDEARRRRQRGRGPGEAQGEEPKAHSKEEIGTPSPSA